MRARSTPSVALLLTLAVALALLGSCSSNKDDPSAGATLPPPSTQPSTTTTTGSDPFAIPKVIDEAYVNKVLAALYKIDGDLLRRVVSENKVPSEASETLRAIYNDPQFELELEGLIKTFAKGLGQFKRPPGDRKVKVARLVKTKPDCIFAEVTLDFSNVVVSPPPAPDGETHFLALQLTQASADRANLNTTPWSVGYTEVVKRGTSPQEQPCDG